MFSYKQKNVLILFFVICYITKKMFSGKDSKGLPLEGGDRGVLNWLVVCLEKTERRLGF